MKNGLSPKKRKEFGAFLLNKRKELGYSVRDVAKICGVPFGVYAAIERGEKAKIRMTMLDGLSTLYQVNNDDMCAMCERIPRPIFYKIVSNPKLIDIIRNIEV